MPPEVDQSPPELSLCNRLPPGDWLFSRLDDVSGGNEEVIECQNRDLRFLAFVSEVRLPNASSLDTSFAPRSVVGVSSGFVPVDILLRRHTGVFQDALRLTLVILDWCAVYETILLVLGRLMHCFINVFVFSKQAVWEVRRLIVTAAFRGQNLAANDC